MERIKGYFKSALFNIVNNWSYAVFYMVGTALAFVFIAILLQLNFAITHNTIPYLYGDRTVHINHFYDNHGQNVGGILFDEQHDFKNNIKGAEAFAVSKDQYGNLFTSYAKLSGLVTFVNLDFWAVNKFKFLDGRPFEKTEYQNRESVCVMKKSFSEKLFGKENAVGNFFEFQDVKYKVIGIVDDYSSITTNNASNIWVPMTFNKYVPDARKYYDTFILFPQGSSISYMKEQVGNAVKFYFQNKGIAVLLSPDSILTVHEEKIKILGGKALSLGVSLIVFILLIIPALNIVTLNFANLNNRSLEMSIRRAIGATSLSIFIQLMFENFIIVICGLILGIILTYPVVSLIENLFLDMPLVGKMSLLNGIDFIVIVAYLIPLGIVFTFMSGAIPAFRVSKRNLAIELKGGTK